MERTTYFVVAALTALALWIRFPIVRAAPYGDEAIHYVTSRFPWQAHLPTGYLYGHFAWPDLFWERPAFFLAYFPSASLGFTAFHVQAWVISGALVPALWWAMDGRGPRWLRTGFCAIVAVDPLFVVWGTRTFPDSLAALFLLLGIGLHSRQKFGAPACFVLACWVKELAIPAVAAIAIAETFRTREAPWKTPLPWATLVGALPVAICVLTGSRPPGWSTGGELSSVFETLFLNGWILVLFVVAFASNRKDPSWVVAVAVPGFLLVRFLFTQGAVEGWYGILAVLPVLVTVAQAWRSGMRSLRVGATVAIVLTLVSPMLGGMAHPLTGQSALSGHVAARAAAVETAAGAEAASWLEARAPPKLLLVDVGWYQVAYPFQDVARNVTFAWTWLAEQEGKDLGSITDAMRQNQTVTLLLKLDTRVNHALRVAGAECVVWENNEFVVFEGARCPRLDRVFAPVSR